MTDKKYLHPDEIKDEDFPNEIQFVIQMSKFFESNEIEIKLIAYERISTRLITDWMRIIDGQVKMHQKIGAHISSDMLMYEEIIQALLVKRPINIHFITDQQLN